MNAKELILGYINATPLTAGFYMAGLAYNVSMTDVFEIMKHPLIEKFTNYVSKNPFSQEMFQNLDKVVEKAAIVGGNNVMLSRYKEDWDTEYDKDSDMEIKVKRKKYFPDEYSTQSFEELGITGTKEEKSKEFERLKREFLKLSKLSSEYKLLGQLLALNQGLKYDSFDFYNFAENLNKRISVNDLYEEAESLSKLAEKYKKAGNTKDYDKTMEEINRLKNLSVTLVNVLQKSGMDNQFDLNKYIELLKDKEANKEILDEFKKAYEGITDYINHLAMLESPQVLAQLQVYDAQTNVNQTIANNDKFADAMTKTAERYDKDTFNQYRRLYPEIVADKYINERANQFTVPVNVDYNGIMKSVTMDFTDPSHREFFIKWFDLIFVNKLKELKSMKENDINKFVTNLTMYDKKGEIGTKLFSNVFLADNLSKIILKYQIREDFNLIYNDYIKVDDTGNEYKIGDMFKLYNLLQYSNRPIRDSFTILMPIEQLDDFIRFDSNINVDELLTPDYIKSYDEHLDNTSKKIFRKYAKNNKEGNTTFDYDSLLDKAMENLLSNITIGEC